MITELLILYCLYQKSGYDQIIQTLDFKEILENLESASIYSEGNLAKLTTILKISPTSAIAGNSAAIKLFVFHKTLINTLKLSKKLLTTDLVNNDFETTLNNGVLIFQIIIDGEGLETDKYIKIFTALESLVETIAMIVNEEQKSELILLDSGSDTNLGLKAGVETAKSLFLVFKEIWDFIVNRKFYQQQQINKALLESLTIRAQIKEKVESGVITSDEGQTYSHIIKTRADELIGLKVLPKELVGQTNVLSNKNLLSEYQDFKRLGTTQS